MGSTFSIFDEDAVGDATGDGREVTVAGIMENYVGHYVYFTPTLYEQVMGEGPFSPRSMRTRWKTRVRARSSPTSFWRPMA